MAQSRAFVDASHALNDLSHAMALLESENAKLRELVRDMWRDGMCECDERSTCAQCDYHFPDRMRELGVTTE